MQPSRIRERILGEHAELRERLARMEALIGRAEGGEAEACERLAAEGRALGERFRRHLELEEQTLVPALREADAWGPERADGVLHEHADQRERLAELMTALERCDAARAVELLRPFVQDLLVDMSHEEEAVLSPDLLRDDVVAIDVETG